MKAVDAVTLQVSVISSFPSGNVYLPDASAMVPEPTHPLNGSPVKQQECNGSLSVQGSVKKYSSSDDDDLLQPPIDVSSSNQNSSVLDCTKLSSSYSSVNGSLEKNECRNGVGREEDKYDESSRVSENSVVNNGYDRGDDEKHSLESLTDIEVESGKRSSSPPEDIPRYRGLQADSGLESAASSWDRTVAEVKEHAVTRLQDELRKAREELKLRDEEVERLSRIRQEVESELEELTASLFQEAHNMVRIANERQAAAEKALRESTMQVDVLTAEVAALKTLVLTSTPSRPNPHLHPQIDPNAKDETATTGNALFRKHRRSPSHYNLKYGRENSPPESPVKDPRPATSPTELVEYKDGIEVDPVMHKEFLAWKQNPTTEQNDPFIARIYHEDIDICLAFTNCELATEVRSAVQSGSIYIEAVNEKTKTHFPKKCALLEVPRQCQYRMRLGETDTWHSISQICRNRIIAVCDFLNYLNYIQRGLVKSSVHDIYWEIVRLRKEMVIARLGLPLVP
uniref:GDP/GTP exchange factor Sec2 N-terminal domain-containing protein n=1 Tax=Graphocephala atropunctata TaxID=36148 RepID=A0A1B6M6Y5_9HEMI